MSTFLEEITDEEIEKAHEKAPESEDPRMQEVYEQDKVDAALARLKKIRVWHEIGDNFTNKDKQMAIKEHKERMGRERK